MDARARVFKVAMGGTINGTYKQSLGKALESFRADLLAITGRPIESRIDPRTGRPLGDHGTANQAIEYTLEEVSRRDFGDTEALLFLKCWREGNLDEWPEFYAWLKTQEG